MRHHSFSSILHSSLRSSFMLLMTTMVLGIASVYKPNPGVGKTQKFEMLNATAAGELAKTLHHSFVDPYTNAWKRMKAGSVLAFSNLPDRFSERFVPAILSSGLRLLRTPFIGAFPGALF